MAESRGWLGPLLAGGIVLIVLLAVFGMLGGADRARDGRGRFSLGDSSTTSTSATTAIRESPVAKRRKTADGLAMEDGAAFVEQRRARGAENTPGGHNQAEGRRTPRAASQREVDGYKDVPGSGERRCRHSIAGPAPLWEDSDH
ncbi:hypothetical protein DFJ74DRAFT_645668 [Hyaloraphidium curvatum]|nr:hypothetical protein DFJ74DRAFT_645668 [Hyaloraphidium curvatum]